MVLRGVADQSKEIQRNSSSTRDDSTLSARRQTLAGHCYLFVAGLMILFPSRDIVAVPF